MKRSFSILKRTVFLSVLIFSQVFYSSPGYALVFSQQTKQVFEASSGFLSAETGDLDGDGKKEIIAYKIQDDAPGAVLIKAGVGAAGLTNFVKLIPTEVYDGNSTLGTILNYKLYDIDGDGKDEVIMNLLTNEGKDGKVSVYEWSGSGFSRLWTSDDLINNTYLKNGKTEDAGGLILSIACGDTNSNGKKEIAVTIVEPVGEKLEESDKDPDDHLIGSLARTRLCVFEYENSSSFIKLSDKIIGEGIGYRISAANLDSDSNTEFAVDFVDLNYANINTLVDYYKDYKFSESTVTYSSNGGYAPQYAPGPAARLFSNVQISSALAGAQNLIAQRYGVKPEMVSYIKNFIGNSAVVNSVAGLLPKPSLAPKAAQTPVSNAMMYEWSRSYHKEVYSWVESFYTLKNDIGPLLKGEIKFIQDDFSVTTGVTLSEAIVLSQSVADVDNDGKSEIIIKTFDFSYDNINAFFTKINTGRVLKRLQKIETKYSIPSVEALSYDEFGNNWSGTDRNITTLRNPKTGELYDISNQTRARETLGTSPFPVTLPTLPGSIFASKLRAIKSDGSALWSQDVWPLGVMKIHGSEVIAASGGMDLAELNSIITYYDGLLKQAITNDVFNSDDNVLRDLFINASRIIPNLSSIFFSSEVKVFNAANGTLKRTIEKAGTFLTSVAGLGDSDNNGKNEYAVSGFNINFSNVNLILDQLNDYLKKLFIWEKNNSALVKKHDANIVASMNRWVQDYYAWKITNSTAPAPLFNEDINRNGKLDVSEDINGNGVLDTEDVGIDGLPNTNDYGEGNGYLDWINEDSLGADGIPYNWDQGTNDGILQPKEDLNKNGRLDWNSYPEDKNNNNRLDTEDINRNGLLDSDPYLEDKNKNGVLDPSEDKNVNGLLDTGEDTNGNGLIDHYNGWPSDNSDRKNEPRMEEPDLGLNYGFSEVKIYEDGLPVYSNSRLGLIIPDIIASDLSGSGRNNLVIISNDFEYTVTKYSEPEYYTGRYYTDYYGNPLTDWSEMRTRYRSSPIVLRGVMTVLAPGELATQTATISGTVQDGFGVKIATATIFAYSGLTLGGPSTFSDGQGNYVLQDLPPGTYTVLCTPPASSGYRGLWKKSITVYGGETITLDFNLESATISGVVTTSSGPLNGAMVAVIGLKTKAKGYGFTTGVGTYTISGLPYDTYTLLCFPPQNSEYSPQSVSLEVSGSLSKNFLLLGAGKISGRVLRNTGSAYTGALVVAYSSGTLITGEKLIVPKSKAWTDGSGNFSLDSLPEGYYDLYACSFSEVLETILDADIASRGRLIAKKMNVQVTSGQTASAGDLVQPVTVGSVSGKVLSADKLPVSSATVLAVSKTKGLSSITSTDAAGVYSLAGLEAGSYNIFCYKENVGANFLSEVKVSAGRNTTDVNFLLFSVIVKTTEEKEVEIDRTKVKLKQGLLEKEAKIIINVNPPAEALSLADVKKKIPEELRASVWEIRATDVDDVSVDVRFRSGQKATLVLPYPAGVSSFKATSLRIFTYNENTTDWEIVPGTPTIDTATGEVSLEVEHFSYYRLGYYEAAPFSDLKKENVKVWPVPYRLPRDLNSGITFSGLTEKTTIKIYNIAAELVATVEKDDATDRVVWKEKPKDGEKPQNLASGVYIYLIGKNIKGKLVIIR